MSGRDNQQERLSIREKIGFFLAGLIEGEGSFVVTIRFNPSTRWGFVIDPEFYIYQHQKRKKLLELAREFFQTGRIWKKPGTINILVYGIKSRRSLEEKVVPFIKKYLYPFTSRREQIDFFLKVLEMLQNKKHHTKEGMLELVEYIYSCKERKIKIPKQALIERILRDHTPGS
jgi:hypothetical protein